ncbi:hypothetical protein E2C01_013598 [Portunus trituberculatus]|uniref:Uncharacterized protein n=1 Tax=Portunus trituberculatus TaxID=210409 RepID=A0A5B7DHQ3_PORTR|nr:hypothetical protein [Portunus trituberculatus]
MSSAPIRDVIWLLKTGELDLLDTTAPMPCLLDFSLAQDGSLIVLARSTAGIKARVRGGKGSQRGRLGLSWRARRAKLGIFFSVDFRYAKRRATTASSSSLEEHSLARSCCLFTFTSRQGVS